MPLNRTRAFLAVLTLAAALPAATFAQAVPIQVPTAPTAAAESDPADPFFDDTVLHDIKLAINEKDWESLKVHFLENTPYPCYWQVDDQPQLRNVQIRSRGTGSRSGAKPGLRVDFDYYTADQKFLGLKSVILRNNTQDPSGMRERLSMELFRRMGLKAEREAHARLFINGRYVGLYTIVESLDKTWLKKNLGENDGHLYKYDFNNAAAAAGKSPFVFEYLGSDPSFYVPVPFKPETLESDPQGEVIARLMQTINDTATAAWRQAMAEYFDLAKFIRHLAIENFLAEEDGLTGDYGPNNFYFYRFENTSRFQFLPWDKSNTFWESPSYSIFRNIDEGTESRRNRLVVRALKDTELRELYLNTLLECAESIMQPAVTAARVSPAASPAIGWLESEVTRMADQIRAANYADPSREIYTNADWDESIRFLTAWAQTRSDIVRAQVAADRARRGIK